MIKFKIENVTEIVGCPSSGSGSLACLRSASVGMLLAIPISGLVDT